MGYNPAIGERHDYDDGTAWVVLIKHMPGAAVDRTGRDIEHVVSDRVETAERCAKVGALGQR